MIKRDLEGSLFCCEGVAISDNFFMAWKCEYSFFDVFTGFDECVE